MPGAKTTGFVAVGVGSLFIYAGMRGFSILKAAQNVIRGSAPKTGQKTNPLTENVGGSGSVEAIVGGGSGQQALQRTAAQFGWGSGDQWQALSSLEMSEAGFNPRAKNPSSGALGLAQALGHGTANTKGTLGNEYGNFGLTDAQNRAANSGDAGAQSLWMCKYVKSKYGNPIKAWAFHRANGWY